MKKVLVTGGTEFVSKYVENYFKEIYEIFVLNRNHKEQVQGVTLIQADRHDLKNTLHAYQFDAVIDVCGYNSQDMQDLLNALPPVTDYIFISSSAVYPETNPQPFTEAQDVGENTIWSTYGTDKIEAERYLQTRFPNVYILRPPYLYGPMQNLYREPFVFECAIQRRPFYIPKDGAMKLQFFHVKDLCKCIHTLLETHPEEHIYNVGNEELVDINTFVEVCYEVVGTPLKKIAVYDHEDQRDYFPFYEYEYALDVTKQKAILAKTISLKEGLASSYARYQLHPEDVKRKKLMEFIDHNLKT